MNGYEYIKTLSVKDIAKALEIERGQAYTITRKGIEGLVRDPYVCHMAFPLPKKHVCTFHKEGCHECMRKFLYDEIYCGTESSPCLTCMERDFCRGDFPCLKYKEYARNQE